MLVPDQPIVTRHLATAWRSGRLAHAYAFVGPAGIGKLDAALRFAAAIIAPHEVNLAAMADDPAGTPFQAGPAGRRVLSGSHPDVRVYAPPEGKRIFPKLVIEELQAGLTLKPMEAPRRVSILDQAHQMNDAAANTFLKTLEEPPGDAVLILLCDEWLAMLETVRSRVQPVRFRSLPADAIRSRLDGALRDALTDQVFAQLAPLAQGSPGVIARLHDDDFPAIREALIQHVLLHPGSAPIDAADRLVELTRRKSDANQEAQRRRLLLALTQVVWWWRDALVASKLSAAPPLDPSPEVTRALAAATRELRTDHLVDHLDRLFDLVTDLLGNQNTTLWSISLADLAPLRPPPSLAQ